MIAKEKLLEKATELFLKYGVKSVSMDDLSKELGVSKKTLYQHVDNKQHLVREVVHNHLHCEREVMEKINERSKDAVDEMLNIARYITDMFENMSDATLYDLKKYYRRIWDEWEDFHREHVFKVISKNLKSGIAEELYREDMDPDIIARLYVVKSSALVDEDLFPSEQFRKNELFRQYVQYHMRGILSPKGYELYHKYFDEFQNSQP